MSLHVSHCIPSDGLTIATLETATMSRCLQIELGSATPKAMREHLAQYYPLFLEGAVATIVKQVCLKVVDVEGMIAWAAWELPYDGPANPQPVNGVPPIWGMNMGFVISLSRAEMKMRNRVLKEKMSFVLNSLATSPTHKGDASTLLLSWPFQRADREGAMCYVDCEEGGERVKLCEELGFVRMDECHIDLTLGGLEGIYTHVAMHSLDLLYPRSASAIRGSVGTNHFYSIEPEPQATAHMDCLSALPEELTSEIVQRVAHKSLPALVSVSRQLHRLVLPRLYRCVHYSGIDTCDSDRVNKGFLVCANYATAIRPARGDWPQCQPSRIVRLSPFLECITTRPQIRSYIATAGFDLLDTDSEATVDMVSYIIDLLLPSLQTLNISPVFYKLDPLRDIKLKSLNISHEIWANRDPGNSYLFALFRISTLRNLSIEIAADWDTSPRWHRPQHSARLRTSNVTSLSFPTGIPFGDDLAEILSWPKALEVFELGPPPVRNKKVLANVLSPEDWPNEYRELFFKDSQTPPQIWEVLPPAIRMLRLEGEPHFTWIVRLFQPMSPPLPKELMMQLSEIAKHKRLRYPNLQEVVLGQPRLADPFQTFILKSLRGNSGIIKDFEESEIRLTFAQDPETSAPRRRKVV
ncbi:hypothetical protein HO173_005504 [Letharia columbiana]|uniref:F-box domain-containing protein n=1 Tax=Letharia columbiana TaxID=112416 RepID=A0A8H6L5J3_9LECA|nr:uncharacterized protein HO173_005504 [Letharia columbiana]KAF6236412.1 hypothetical protein HO173_005504 [Letharia columbiana]